MTASDTVAIGHNATAGYDNSAAFGAGATTTRANQQSFGTASNTYTMAGLPSDASRSFQSGPLEVATSDAAGNLATDGGLIFKGLSQLHAGVAVAIAMQNPDLVAGEKFGVALNWGNFEGANALAFSTMGVLGTDVFSKGDRLAISGSLGASTNEPGYGGHDAGMQVGARVGLQMTWK
ncbi:MAG TPA: hypothetical protein VH913_06775 [Hyphomicrobiaceae bacterium]